MSNKIIFFRFDFIHQQHISVQQSILVSGIHFSSSRLPIGCMAMNVNKFFSALWLSIHQYIFGFAWNGTALSVILPTILRFVIYSMLVVYFSQHTGWFLPMGDKLSPILTIVIGQLLVFRTNTAYERWNEAKKAWTNSIAQTRLFVRVLHLAMLSKQLDDQHHAHMHHYHRLVDLLLGFSLAMKTVLRENVTLDKELKALLPDHFIATKYLPQDVQHIITYHQSFAERILLCRY